MEIWGPLGIEIGKESLSQVFFTIKFILKQYLA